MFILKAIATTVVVSVAAATQAVDINAELTAAQEKYRAGEHDAAIEQLKPLLESTDVDPASKQRVRALAMRVLESRGDKFFREGQIKESIADYDRQLKLDPDRAAEHWKRGIAYYYAGEYEKGKQQFELHQTVNPQDVENAVWHFLCAVRVPGGTVEAARKQLIPVTRDARVPMAQVQELFAGKVKPDEVLQVGKQAGGAAEFYADLYVGLFYEAIGQNDEALRILARAADNAAGKNNFMGDVARTHVLLRKKAAESKPDAK